jgi:hypothetical protein
MKFKGVFERDMIVGRNENTQKIRRIQQSGFKGFQARRNPLLTWGCPFFQITFSSDATLPRQ